MNRFLKIIFIILAGFILFACNTSSDSSQDAQLSSPEGYAGSVSCRECHGKFYELWSTSFHGLAMQPYTKEFAQENLIPQKESIKIKDSEYRFDVDKGVVIERSPKGKKDYWVKHVMGGKYVYFFLTLMERGRLQVLPVSYDVRKKTWYDTTSSFVRHFVDQTDEPVDWRDPMLTFNTSCHGCHVSQLSTNYDPETDTYRTTWAEPGINCEACHGPGHEHNRIAEATPEGQPLEELKIISTKTMTPEQRDQTCATCHTKGGPITTGFTPGERYFDNFDLVALEHPDFYPDGRDLGENYTYTLWRMSPCVKSGKLECLHCHTSSGRYRFKLEKFNDACMPCHEKQVNNPEVHTHHKPDSEGNRCITCHMPQTEFARMTRSDHSMRPPMPAATIKFKSPNACNICHEDKDPQWADTWVRKWRKRNYQKPVIHVSGLVNDARKRDWSRLKEMLEYITRKDRDEIYATSLIRLLGPCNDPAKLPTILNAAKDPSPLVRAAAVETLSSMPSMETLQALIKATGDDYRLVRVRAADALSVYRDTIAEMQLENKDKRNMSKAKKEFISFLLSRPDQWMSHYNMGNFQLESGKPQAALSSYEKSLELDPRAIPALVNMSMAYARMGKNNEAEESLQKALEIEPENSAANFNLGLLLAQQGRMDEAEKALRTALKSDPQLAPAAYNLCVMLAGEKIDEALGFCRKAYELLPDEPKYGYTLAFYQYQKGETDDAVKTLNDLLKKYPGYRDAQMLLQEISNKKHKLF
jgi:tetratricopeptide (TPR) repeat protein